MSGFASALAGGLAGLGKGLVEDAAAQRDANLKRLEQEFRREEAAADRSFRAGESAADREQREKLAIMQEKGANSRAGMAAGSAAASRTSAERLAIARMEHDKEMARLTAELRAAELAEARAYESGNADKQREHAEKITRLQAELTGEARREEHDFNASEADKDRAFRKDENKAEYERRTGLQISQQEFAAGQAALDRGFRADESTLDRSARREESAADREARLALGGTAVPSATGGFSSIVGDTARPIKNPDGSDFRPAPKAEDPGAKLKLFNETYETLIEGGGNPDAAMEKALTMSGIPFAMVEGKMLPKVDSPAMRAALPSGARYVAPDGSVRVVP